MIVLSATTDKIEALLGGAAATAQVRCVACWRDVTTTTYTPGRTAILTNGTTPVTVVGAPASATQRVVDFLNCYNADSATVTLTVQLNDNGTAYILWRGALAPGERLEYGEGTGFRVKALNGLDKVQSQVAAYTANQINIVVMASDVVNNNGTANTIADVTGLSFAVNANETYWFEFIIPYTSAATTTGSRWSINGPAAPTMLAYRSEYTLTATSLTNNSATAYDIPAASSASSLTTGNIATIWGVITPSGSGTVIARFASEVLSSAITAKAGATLRWIRVL